VDNHPSAMCAQMSIIDNLNTWYSNWVSTYKFAIHTHETNMTNNVIRLVKECDPHSHSLKHFPSPPIKKSTLSQMVLDLVVTSSSSPKLRRQKFERKLTRN